jgi:nicotinate-nucleotide adenylyltransferase
MTETLGIFGGTFDPPHLGHLILAAEALSQLELTRVLWVLTPQSPLKLGQALTALPHRLEMLKRALDANPGFELSTLEFERPAPHYTIDTLRLLRERFPSAQLVLLIGGDSLRDLPAWGQPEAIIELLAAFGVMRRPGDQIDLSALEARFPGIQAKVRFVEAPQLEIAASTIRQRIASGGHFRYYLPPAVYDYIQQNNLYR